MAKGIRERHTRSCRTNQGGRCSCDPSFEAQVWSSTEAKPIRKTFRDRSEAQSWVRDAKIALRRGQPTPSRTTGTLRQVADEWHRLAAAGVVRNDSGDEYKPATLRAYDQHLRLRVLEVYGAEPITDLSRPDWQRLVDDLLAAGTAAATIGATVAAAAAVYHREIDRGRLTHNPTAGLKLPTPDGRRERFASPGEAAALLAVVPTQDRPIWATAIYAGLRLGELQALTARDVRLEDGVLEVLHGWDRKAGRIPTKGRNRRKVPIASTLREALAAELLRTDRRDDALVFGKSDTTPFAHHGLQRRADLAWKADGLNRITPHECRHTCASLMIAAGLNAKALSTYMGHASIAITYDRYGHLMPGNEQQAAELLDTCLARESRAG